MRPGGWRDKAVVKAAAVLLLLASPAYRGALTRLTSAAMSLTEAAEALDRGEER